MNSQDLQGVLSVSALLKKDQDLVAAGQLNERSTTKDERRNGYASLDQPAAEDFFMEAFALPKGADLRFIQPGTLVKMWYDKRPRFSSFLVWVNRVTTWSLRLMRLQKRLSALFELLIIQLYLSAQFHKYDDVL